MEQRLIVSSSPHVRTDETVSKTMIQVLIALAPATLWGIYIFGMHAAFVIMACILGAVLSEAAVQKIRKKKISINDFSAVLTGLLLALCVPPSLPIWMAFLGSAFAIIVVKQLFGGLGHNFMNPAHAGRAFLMACYPVAMTSWHAPFVLGAADAVTSATPLGMLKLGDVTNLPSFSNAAMGFVGGSIGETSAILLLLGGLYLIWKGVIKFHVPAVYLGTVFILATLFSGFNPAMGAYHLVTGGLMIGAFFMATDYSTSPVTYRGQLIFALGCGIITTLVRFYGGYPEGVCYSILIMNVATPLIEKYTAAKVFGGAKA